MLRRLRWILSGIGRGPQLDAAMDAEMRAHVEMEADDLVRRGLDPATARRRAAATFGGIAQAKEAALDDRALPAVHDLGRGVRLAIRTLGRHRGFTTMTVLALGLAIAVNTTTFSVLDAMINPRILANHPERLYNVRFLADARLPLRFEDAADALSAGGRTFESFTEWAYPGGWGAVTERGGIVREADQVIVKPNFFGVMGAVPLEGRLLPPDDAVAASNLIVISDRLRAELFPDRTTAAGQTVVVEGRPLTVLGVVSRTSGAGMLDYDVWRFPPPEQRTFQGRLIRLRPGVTLPEVQAELDFLARRSTQAAGLPDATARFVVTPMARQFSAGRFHYALVGAALAVLLIACTNLANLQLARGLGRSGEIAVQSALGATRRHVVIQLMTENAVMAVGGLVLAVLLTFAANAAIRATIPRSIGQYVVAPQTSWRMILFATLAAGVSLLLVGILPAIRTSRVDISALLKGRAGSGAHRQNARWYGTLVVLQIALALPLVEAAAMCALGAWKSARNGVLVHELGYDPRLLVTARVSARVGSATTDSARHLLLSDAATWMVGQAKGIPFVADAALTVTVPAARDAVSIEDDAGVVHQFDAPLWRYDVVTPSYLRTMGIPVAEGTDFPAGAGGDGSVLVDQATATILWPRSNPVGRRLKLGATTTDAPWLRVRGVIGSPLTADEREMVRETMMTRLGRVMRVVAEADSVPANLYRRYEATLYVRVDSQPQAVASALRRSMRDERIFYAKVQLQLDWLGIPRRLAIARFIAAIFGVMGILALGLAGMGVYGIVAQAVGDRRREIAIRIALGATPGKIVHALLRQHNVLLLLGIAIGLGIAERSMGLVGEFLGPVGMIGLALYGIMCVVLFVSVAVSALVPAMQATRVSVMEVLRAE